MDEEELDEGEVGWRRGWMKKWDEEEMSEDEGRWAIYLVCFAPMRTFATWATENPNKHTAYVGVWEGVNSYTTRRQVRQMERTSGSAFPRAFTL